MKKYLIIVGLIAVVALVVKKRTSERADWQGLSEAEARQRLADRFPDRMPEDKREFVTDKIVTKMRDQGVIVDDGEAELDLTESVDLSDDTAADETVVEEV